MDSLLLKFRVNEDRMGSARSPDSGFTLVEMLVIVAILGIMVSLAYGGLTTLRARYQITEAANEMYSDLQWIKQRSIGSTSLYSIHMDTSNDSYTIRNGTTVIAHKNFSAIVDMSENIPSSSAILFTRRGITYDNGSIVFSCHNNRCSKQISITISQFNVEIQ